MTEKNTKKNDRTCVPTKEEAKMVGYFTDSPYYEETDGTFCLVPKTKLKQVVKEYYENKDFQTINELIESKEYISNFDPDATINLSNRVALPQYLRLVKSALENNKSLSNQLRTLLKDSIESELEAISKLPNANMERIKNAKAHMQQLKNTVDDKYSKEDYYPSFNYTWPETRFNEYELAIAIKQKLKQNLKDVGISEEDINHLFKKTTIPVDKEEINVVGENLDVTLSENSNGLELSIQLIWYGIFNDFDENIHYGGWKFNSLVDASIPEEIQKTEIIEVNEDGENIFSILLTLMRFPIEVTKDDVVLVNGVDLESPEFIEKLLGHNSSDDESNTLDLLLENLDSDILKAKQIMEDKTTEEVLPKFDKWLLKIIKDLPSQTVSVGLPGDLALIVRKLVKSNKDFIENLIKSRDGGRW